jgi:hypothetical protein
METTMSDKPGQARINLTDDRLRKIQLPDAGKRAYHCDTTTTGLRLAVSATGNKSFQYQAWSSEKQRPVTITLGKWPSMPIHVAREKADTLQSSVNAGNDPELDKKQKRDTILVGEMLDIYLEEFSMPRNRTWEYDAAKIEMYLKPSFESSGSTMEFKQMTSYFS